MIHTSFPLARMIFAVALALSTDPAPAAAADDTPSLPAQNQQAAVNILDIRLGEQADERSHTRTTSEDLRQVQVGEANAIRLHIGNVTAGGRSDVSVRRVMQRQSGDGNAQGIRIGNAVGQNSAARVVAVELSQDQRGGGRQVLHIGNADVSGQSRVQVTRVEQRQSADPASRQSTEAGTARLSNSFLLLDDFEQFQEGEEVLQSTRIGNAAAGAGSTHVTAHGIVQWQFGRGLAQYLSIGNAGRGGSTLVHASELVQSQSGDSNLLSLTIGDADEAPTAVLPLR